MQKIKVGDLWKYTGCTVYIQEELSNEYLPVGYYIYVDKLNDAGYILTDDFGVEYLLDTATEEDTVLVKDDFVKNLKYFLNYYAVSYINCEFPDDEIFLENKIRKITNVLSLLKGEID